MATTNKGTARASLTRAVRSLGGTIEYAIDREGIAHEITADAPIGFVWAASFVHQLVSCGSDGEPMDDLIADMIERVGHGLVTCDDDACEICHPDEAAS